MLAMVEQKETRHKKLQELRIQREKEIIAALKPEIEKYRQIAASEYGKSMKSAAWKNLIAKCPAGWADGVEEGDCGHLLIMVNSGGKSFVESLGMEFVHIRPGAFMMGSPSGLFSGESGRDDDENQHRVTLTKGFYMQTTEVTQGQWKAVMGARPWSGEDYVRDANNSPAVYVSWNDAQKFIKKLNRREGVNKYHLPTEAEWEYTCRAGSTARFCFGDSDSQLGDYAWWDGNADNIGEDYAHRVGAKKPNAWGLYDMHGNVWEWCWDSCNYKSGVVTDTYRDGIVDPLCTKGSSRVCRGGSWFNNARG